MARNVSAPGRSEPQDNPSPPDGGLPSPEERTLEEEELQDLSQRALDGDPHALQFLEQHYPTWTKSKLCNSGGTNKFVNVHYDFGPEHFAIKQDAKRFREALGASKSAAAFFSADQTVLAFISLQRARMGLAAVEEGSNKEATDAWQNRVDKAQKWFWKALDTHTRIEKRQ